MVVTATTTCCVFWLIITYAKDLGGLFGTTNNNVQIKDINNMYKCKSLRGGQQGRQPSRIYRHLVCAVEE